MQQAWLAFARTGSPQHERLPEWPAFDAEAQTTMFLAGVREIREKAFPSARFWAALL